jgi:tetratricopeptide (TPR) repeat protein
MNPFLLHENANNLYHKKLYVDAINIYSSLIEGNYKLDIIYSNRSACYLQLKEYTKSLNDSLKSLETTLGNAKAWGRVGYSYKGLKKHLEAIKAFEFANNLDKNNKIYINELKFYDRKFTSKLTISNLSSLMMNKNIYNLMLNLKDEMKGKDINTIFKDNNVEKILNTILQKI